MFNAVEDPTFPVAIPHPEFEVDQEIAYRSGTILTLSSADSQETLIPVPVSDKVTFVGLPKDLGIVVVVGITGFCVKADAGTISQPFPISQ